MNKESVSYWKARIFQAEYPQEDGSVATAANWTMRCSLNGSQRKVTLPTPEKSEAAKLALEFYQTLKRSGSWEDAARVIGRTPEKPGAELTVGGWIATVTGLGILNRRTLESYAYGLRWFAREHLELPGSRTRFDGKGGGSAEWRAKLDSVKVSDLNLARVQRIVDRYVQDNSATPLARKRAAVSVRSFVRNARALFSRPILKRSPLDLTPIPFYGLELPEVGALRYSSTVDIGALLKAAREELRETRPSLWISFLLGFGAGLRRGEMAALTWDQVRFERSSVSIRSSETFTVKTDGSEDEVFLDPSLLGELKSWRANPQAEAKYVLPGSPVPPPPGQGWRCDSTVFSPLISWLRQKGVADEKPLHMLRKEFGSFIAATADIHTAQRQLRHSQISTTAAYYAENRRRIAPPIGEPAEKTP